ncbi:MAG: NADPH-dependent F420 reductase [Caulobacterales bacterium]|nr:NADPH-dependent F420 reductase [Caulobacterales bacterium]
MTYAIIGTGNVGTALARQFARAGIDVAIANRQGPDSIQPLVDELGAHVTATTLQAALDADVILLAIPFVAVEELAKTRADWAGKIVIDATNAYGVSPQVMAGRLSSDIVAKAVSGANVVKTFNQLPAALLARDPAQDGGRRVIFVAGNDETATTSVKDLASRLGFSAIVVGRIDEGGRLLHIPGPLVLHNLVEFPLKSAS